MSGRARILVVDDEPDVVSALRSWLEASLPVDVVASFSGTEALQVMRRHPVDLVIADYRMPGMDGLHFLRRAHELRPGAARILMTAYADIGLVIDAVNQAKAARFVRKPLEAERFVAVVREALAEAQAEQAAQAQHARHGAEAAGWPASGEGPAP